MGKPNGPKALIRYLQPHLGENRSATEEDLRVLFVQEGRVFRNIGDRNLRIFLTIPIRADVRPSLRGYAALPVVV